MPDELPMTGLTKEMGLWIETIRPEAIEDGARGVVSGLIARMLTATGGQRGDTRPDPAPSGADSVGDAFALAAGLRAESFPEQHAGLMDLAAPVVGASLATATHHPCSGASLGASILAGCELGLMLAELAGAGASSPFSPLAAPAAAAAAARVLDLRADRLVSAIGIGVSSTVGAAVTTGVAWQAGKSASNGVLAALLAGAGFTGPPDAVEHPRGLLGAIFGVHPQVGTTARFGNRIGALKPLVASARPAGEVEEKATGLWEMERGSDLFAALIPDRGRR